MQATGLLLPLRSASAPNPHETAWEGEGEAATAPPETRNQSGETTASPKPDGIWI